MISLFTLVCFLAQDSIYLLSKVFSKIDVNNMAWLCKYENSHVESFDGHIVIYVSCSYMLKDNLFKVGIAFIPSHSSLLFLYEYSN